MDNDRRKIELMNSLLLSFPGTPIIYYGDEIGMGDNIYLGDRNGVRTPMQWTPDRNGGFSRCDPAKLYLPPIMDPVYGYQAVNVEAQSRSLSSLLSWTKRMIAVRKTSQVFGRGTLSFVRPKNRAVLAYVREYAGEAILCVANLSRSAQAAELDLSAWKGRIPEEMVGRSRFHPIDDRAFVVTLAPYGFFWLQLCEGSEGTHGAAPLPEWVTLVVGDGWKWLNEGRMRQLFEREVLPPFLTSRRWFAHKEGEQIKARLEATLPLSADERTSIALIDVSAGSGTARYALPLAVDWQRVDPAREQARTALLAPVRRANREGALIDGAMSQDLIATMLRQIHANATVGGRGRQIAFRASQRFAEVPRGDRQNPPLNVEQSNSSVVIDDLYVLKFYRRVPRGRVPSSRSGGS